MKIYSNLPFSEISQKWNENQHIYYYNMIDNGVQQEGNEGNRFEADFVIVGSLNSDELDEAITRASLAPNVDRLIVDNIEIVKHQPPEGKIKVFLKYKNASLMIQAHPDLTTYIKDNAIPIIFEKDGVYIYLSIIYDEHRKLFNEFNAVITDNLTLK